MKLYASTLVTLVTLFAIAISFFCAPAFAQGGTDAAIAPESGLYEFRSTSGTPMNLTLKRTGPTTYEGTYMTFDLLYYVYGTSTLNPDFGLPKWYVFEGEFEPASAEQIAAGGEIGVMSAILSKQHQPICQGSANCALLPLPLVTEDIGVMEFRFASPTKLYLDAEGWGVVRTYNAVQPWAATTEMSGAWDLAVKTGAESGARGSVTLTAIELPALPVTPKSAKPVQRADDLRAIAATGASIYDVACASAECEQDVLAPVTSNAMPGLDKRVVFVWDDAKREGSLQVFVRATAESDTWIRVSTDNRALNKSGTIVGTPVDAALQAVQAYQLARKPAWLN